MHARTHQTATTQALSKIFASGMPTYLKRRVYSLFNTRSHADRITYAEFSAFNDFLRHLPAIETAIFEHFIRSVAAGFECQNFL